MAYNEFSPLVSSDFDYCLVIKKEAEAKLFEGNIVNFFRENFGLIAEVYSNDKVRDEIFINIAAPLDCLREFCSTIEFDFLLDKEKLKTLAKLKGVEIDHLSKDYPTHLTPIDPFDLIFTDYCKQEDNKDFENLYHRKIDEAHPFSKLIRQKLIVMLLESKDVKINELLINREILGFFPPHEVSKKHTLVSNLFSILLLFGKENIEDIRDYFGERVGMYYGFVNHFLLCLLFPGIIGGIFFGIMIRQNTYTNSFFQLIMCFVIVLWTPLVLKLWKRKECMYALKWGTFDAEDDERERPEFTAPLKMSPISGEMIIYFPEYKRNFRIIASYVVIGTVILLVLGTLSGIYYLQLKNIINTYVRSLLTAMSIEMYNFIYNIISIKLNNWENYRTDTEYEDALIMKVFLFQFVNHYISFFYIAYIQQYISEYTKCSGLCVMEQLAYNIAIIVAIELIYVPISKFMIPFSKFYYNLSNKKITKSEYKTLSIIEKEFSLVPFDDLNIILYSYHTIAILYGYVTMFGAALPLAPLVVLVCVFISNIADLSTLLNYYQRPVPKAAQDIGTWQFVLTIISVISVSTNAGLLVFSMPFLNDLKTVARFWVFIGFQAIFLFYLFVVHVCIPDKPEMYKIQMKRIEFMQENVLKHKNTSRGGSLVASL